MNRCEEVLKHSVNKGLKIEKDELYHSDTYLGSEYDEGLKHWKYIRKYKNSKGKTVYVYASDKSHSGLKINSKEAERLKGLPEWEMKGPAGSITQRVQQMKKAKEYQDKYNQYAKDLDDFYDKHDVIKNIKAKVKKGFDFIEGYLKYLSGK